MTDDAVRRQPPHPTRPGASWLETPRLVLRRPLPDDLDDYVALHTDPRTYAHAPASMPDEEGCRSRLASDLREWESIGMGHAAVVERASGRVVGWGGLRVRESDPSELNLYYRLEHAHLGAGLGREMARALVAWGVEHRPERVTAMVHRVNAASLATATGAGLVVMGTRRRPDDGPDDEPLVLLVAPAVEVVDPASVDGAVTEAVLDLWTRVNDAGGAVGFLPGTPRPEVAAALDRHLADVFAGRSLLCVLRGPGGALLGLGLWQHSRGFPYEHVAWLVRFMVDPRHRGRNLGHVLLAGMVGVARRRLPEVELLRLDYRGGLGLGTFYRAAGWEEVGRVPGGLRLSGADRRDDVAMARRVDAGPLRPQDAPVGLS